MPGGLSQAQIKSPMCDRWKVSELIASERRRRGGVRQRADQQEISQNEGAAAAGLRGGMCS